ncbi:MAG: hypothetical protein R2708_09860 [Vicinamibacterales bacterium]
MSRRLPLVAALLAVALVVLARAVPFMAPGVRMDADQAVMGLMAKHIAEGRAFPLYFYGQDYLLAIEAYLAAPVMWVLGPTEVALKLPVLAMNLAAAGLLVWHAVRGVGLTPWLAVVAALPFALPPAAVGSRLMDAMGGNIETPFYALLLWTVRDRRWLFGAVTAVAVAHRELVAYPLAALLALDVLAGAWRSREAAARWAIAAAGVVALHGALTLVRPQSAMFGPGTTAREADVTLSSAAVVRGQLCFDVAQWPARGRLIAAEHLPLMAGGAPGPLIDLGVSTGVGQGRPGAFPWCSGSSRSASVRPGSPAAPTPARPTWEPGAGSGRSRRLAAVVPGAVRRHLDGVYAFVSCANITTHTLRYNLLVVFLPAGAVMAGLRHPSRAVRAALATALLVWLWPAADDYRALGVEVASGRWPDDRGRAVAALAARGPAALLGRLPGGLRAHVPRRGSVHGRLARAPAHRPLRGAPPGRPAPASSRPAPARAARCWRRARGCARPARGDRTVAGILRGS